jgi:hypothetical protein
MAHAGHRTVVVERRWVGGSCPNLNCLPSKNVLWSTQDATLVCPAPCFAAFVELERMALPSAPCRGMMVV